MKSFFLLLAITLSSYSAMADDFQPIKCSEFITHITDHVDTEDSFRLMVESANNIHPKYLPRPPSSIILSIDRDFFDKTIAECRAVPDETLLDSMNHAHDAVSKNIAKSLKIRGEHYRQIAETAKNVLPRSITCQNIIDQYESHPELTDFPNTIFNYMLIQPVFGGPGVDGHRIEKYMNIIVKNTLNTCKIQNHDLFYPIMNNEIQKQATIAENTEIYP